MRSSNSNKRNCRSNLCFIIKANSFKFQSIAATGEFWELPESQVAQSSVRFLADERGILRANPSGTWVNNRFCNRLLHRALLLYCHPYCLQACPTGFLCAWALGTGRTKSDVEWEKRERRGIYQGKTMQCKC